MNARLRLSLGLLAVIVVSATLPLAGKAFRGERPDRCHTDGVTLVEAPRVRVVMADGAPLAFCCVRCAQEWLEATGGAPSRVLVTDAISGELVDAAEAFFVRSRVYAQPATGDRVHAFADRAAAEKHADAYRGRVLDGDARPFGTH